MGPKTRSKSVAAAHNPRGANGKFVKRNIDPVTFTPVYEVPDPEHETVSADVQEDLRAKINKQKQNQPNAQSAFNRQTYHCCTKP